MTAFRPNYNQMLRDVEKQVSLNIETYSSKLDQSVSSGMLSVDLILGNGGWIPGLHTSLGFEQSAKTTLVIHSLHEALAADIPVIELWDYEKTFSSDYAINFHNNGHMTRDTFGKLGTGGRWEVEPRIPSYDSHTMEDFFNAVHALLKQMPRKRKIEDTWFYVYKKSQQNLRLIDGQYDKGLYRSLDKYCVEAEDGLPQAFLVIDSYPNMLPENMDSDEISGAAAVQARAFSDHLKRVKALIASRNAVWLGVNQIRTRPMIGYATGCFRGQARVLMADGTEKYIEDVVLNKDPGPIMSYNKETGKVEAKRITNWYVNGRTDDWLQIHTNASEVLGPDVIECTPNHKFMLYAKKKKKRKLVSAADLRVGDRLLAVSNRGRPSLEQRQVMIGSLLGDGCFNYKAGKWSIEISHKVQDVFYLKYKNKILKDQVCYFTKDVGDCGAMCTLETVSVGSKWMRDIRKEMKPGSGRAKEYPKTLIELVDPIGLAIWYMDDAAKNRSRIKMQSFPEADAKKIVDRLNERFGTQIAFHSWKDSRSKTGRGWGCSFDTRMLRLIMPYVHKKWNDRITCSRARRVIETFGIGARVKEIQKTRSGDLYTYGEVIKRIVPTAKSPEMYRGSNALASVGEERDRRFDTTKYDLEVEDNHLYVIDGVIVHNSPEYEPCGNSLQINSDVRLAHRGVSIPPKYIVTGTKDKKHLIEKSVSHKDRQDSYRFITIDIVKNKVGGSPVGTRIHERIWEYDGKGTARGLDPVFDTWQYLLLTGQLEGNLKKFALDMEGNPLHGMELTYPQFKTLITGRPEGKKGVIGKKEVCAKLGINENPRIRQWCFDQLQSGVGYDFFSKYG